MPGRNPAVATSGKGGSGPAERQPAVERGLAMTLDDAVAYALATEPAKTA